MIELKEIKINNFAEHLNEFVRIYLSAFTTGEHAQFISEKTASNTLKNLSEKGVGYFAKTENQVVGIIFAHPLEMDNEFPVEKNTLFDTKKSLYIAEVLVDNAFRGQGIATLLLKEIEKTAVEKGFETVSLRVWDENVSAVSLYRKMGFEDTGISILQTKLKDEQTTFEMKKLYLYKNLLKP